MMLDVIMSDFFLNLYPGRHDNIKHINIRNQKFVVIYKKIHTMKLSYLLAILLFIVSAGKAQQKRDTVHHAATAKKAKMKDELGLNKKQEADIKASKKEFKSEKEKVKNDTKLTEAQKKEKIKALKTEKKKEVDATLTPEQKEKAKALKAEKKKDKKEKKKG